MLKFFLCLFLSLATLLTVCPYNALAVDAINGGDIIYFVLTDRWQDGDPNNNQDVDKSKPKFYHGGDFEGIIQSIPYLKDLGVTTLWITPVYKQIGKIGPDEDPSFSYHGYWFSNPNRVDRHLYSGDLYPEGDLRYFKDFVNKMHAEGIKVILDLVFNHTGYHNDAYEAEVAAHPKETIRDDWFNRGGSGEIKGTLAGLPDINHDLVDVRDFFIKNTAAWIDCGIDGIRLDTTKHLEDALWQDLKQTIWSKYPNLIWIGEVLLFDVGTLASYQNDDGLDSVFDFAFYQTIKDTFIYNASMEKFAKKGLFPNEPDGLFDLDRLYRDPNLLATVTDNHDLSSRILTAIKGQYGDTDIAQKVMKLMFGLQFTTRGIPKIYYGTEVGLEGYSDPDNRKDMDFSRQGSDLYNFVKRLIAIRKGSEALQYGTLTTLYSDQFVYAFLRHYGNEEKIIVINNGQEEMPSPLSIAIVANGNLPSAVKERLNNSTLTDVLTGQTYSLTDSFAIALPGKGMAILE